MTSFIIFAILWLTAHYLIRQRRFQWFRWRTHAMWANMDELAREIGERLLPALVDIVEERENGLPVRKV